MEKINEEAEQAYPTKEAYELACKALWKHRDENEKLQAECLKYREALEKSYIENQNLNCHNLPSKRAQKALHDQTVILREALKSQSHEK